MVGELFLPHDMPEPPKEGFFKGLFGGGVRSVDREELCKLTTLMCHIVCHHSITHPWAAERGWNPSDMEGVLTIGDIWLGRWE
jgi:hypothetical protein